MKAEVYGRQSRERQKKRWSDMLQQDLVTRRLKLDDADDRDKWKRRIHVADSSRGINAATRKHDLETFHRSS